MLPQEDASETEGSLRWTLCARQTPLYGLNHEGYQGEAQCLSDVVLE